MRSLHSHALWRLCGMFLAFLTALASEAIADPPLMVDAFCPLKSIEPSAKHKDGIRTYLGEWRFVPPFWIVATIETEPAWTGLPVPADWPEPESTAVIVVDARTGRARRLQLTDANLMIRSVLPMDDNICGFVVQKRDTKGAHNLQLYSWNLATDTIGELRPWANVDPIARHLALDKVTVEWPRNEELTPDSTQITIGGDRFPSSSSIPLPFHHYATPLEMTALWEEGKETRWFAPVEDGVGIVLFRGIRKGGNEAGTQYLPQSTLTLFDPRSKNGVRFQRDLSSIGNDSWKDGLLPIYSHWQRNNTLLLQCANTGHHSTPLAVSLVKLQLQDGSVLNTSTFEADTGFLLDLNWPHCTVDQQRIAYLVEHPKYSPKLAVFDFENARFLDELSLPSRLIRRLVTILRSNDAVVTDDLQLWAVGIGRENYGESRLIVRLFVEPQSSQ